MHTIFLAFFFANILFAGIVTSSVKAVGYGNSYSEAIQNALVNAVAQVKGITIQAKRVFQKRLSQVAMSTNGKSSHIVAIDDSTRSRVASATGGLIDHFKILGVKKLSRYEYRAVVRAYFSHYKAPGHNPRNRRTLAVLPFAYKSSYTFKGIPISGKALSERITQSIINKITQTRKFSVLDRQNSRYYEFEKEFLLSGNTDPIELARLGKRLGADYFIIGQMLDFGIDTQKGNPLIGAIDSSHEAYATINYRILNIPIQQIKWAGTIDITFELPSTRRAESLVAKAGDKIAQVLVEQILFNIYPPKIIRVAGKKVVLNVGGNFFHSGERFGIYALGKKMYDPYTKEFLGRDEQKIGELEITRVLPKISYARIIKGRAKRGAILRRLQNQEEEMQEGKDSLFDAMFPAQ